MDFWNECLKILSQELDVENFDRWVQKLSFVSYDKADQKLTLGHTSLSFLSMAESAVGSAVVSAAARAAGVPVDVRYQTVSAPEAVQENAPYTKEPAKEAKEKPFTGLLEQLTFDNFVQGPSNSIAYSAALRVSEYPGNNYNPLFIYGGVGLGKTHLMHAVGNNILSKDPGKKIYCVSAQGFMSDFTNAVRTNRYTEFDAKYQSLDVLLIDDIQYLCGDKRAIQNKLFDIFEKLVPYGRQVIFTSDTYAKSLKAMDERLISRFTMGLSVEVEPPELETRAMILMKKAQLQRFDLPEDVAFYIARNIKSNVRELEGALQRLIAYHMFRSEGPVTVEFAREALHSLLDIPNVPITVEQIQKAVADYFGISLSDLYSIKRNRSIVVPRQVAMYLAKELTRHSYPEIAARFGKKDHTTVMHAVAKIEKDRKSDSELNYKIHVVEQMLKN